MAYEEDPVSHFQRQMRRGAGPELRDHICKEMSALVDARIERIPTEPGSDWRDLPNAAVKLRDGTHSDKLVYNYHDENEGKAGNGALRGVCVCATKKDGKIDCDPNDKQVSVGTRSTSSRFELILRVEVLNAQLLQTDVGMPEFT